MVDIAADMGLLHTCLELMELSQCVVQGRFNDESTLLQLPYITESVRQSHPSFGSPFPPTLPTSPTYP